MRVSFTKGQTEDRITVERSAGPPCAFLFPKKGPTPHDAFHFFIESGLGLRNAFWGLVDNGADPAEVGAIAAAGGHASAKRAQKAAAHIVELLQAERLVECFEAESWSGACDNDGIRAMAEAGWSASHVPPLPVSDPQLDALREAIAAFADRWTALAVGETVTLDWRNAWAN